MGRFGRPWGQDAKTTVASTSTKNPNYPDTLYVDSLIGPNTVNTLPDQTLLAFEDHGTVARTLDSDFAGAHDVVDRL